jgi:hypothetical protein
LRSHRVKALLMGGQACILYGAAEFSRDVDVAVAVSPANLRRLRAALAQLEAEPILFPPLSPRALRRGHACHFRCRAPGLQGVRLDVMAVFRGAPPFHRLWARRRRIALPGVGTVSVMSLADLVTVKKTQRDKDWPMIRRLVEADLADTSRRPHPARVAFWLRECRTPEMLRDLVLQYPGAAAKVAPSRPAVGVALRSDLERVQRELDREQARQRELDRRHWAPLRRELEAWCLGRRQDVTDY